MYIQNSQTVFQLLKRILIIRVQYFFIDYNAAVIVNKTTATIWHFFSSKSHFRPNLQDHV